VRTGHAPDRETDPETEVALITAVEKDRLVASAQRNLKKGQTKKAIADLERLVSADTGDMRAKLELADLYLQANDRPNAVKTFLRCAERYASDGFGIKAMGLYLQVTRVQINGPEASKAHLALGKHYAEHGQLASAGTHFDKALTTLDDAAKLGDRLAIVTAILDVDPENIGDRIRLAETYSGLGMMNEAVTEFRAVAETLDKQAGDDDYHVVAERILYHQADDANVAKRLASFYVDREEPQRALAKLAKAFDAAPRDLEVLGLLAEAFNQLGQVHKSVSVLKEMARLYDDNGLIHERDECHTKILLLDPNDRSAREALGESNSSGEGQFLEFQQHLLPQPTTNAALGQVLPASSVPPPLSTMPPMMDPASGMIAAGDDLDSDFDFDFEDDDEIGFGGTAENTIVDDAFIPEDVRQHLGSDSGLKLSVPGADTPPPGEKAAGALQEDLRELDFYINNGLLEEADALLGELTSRYGEHPLLDRRTRELASIR
jgi:pilus assembly protein FimV